MKIAYFVNQYPKVSHSFIRREIKALETLGFEVDRIALRGWDEPLVDPADESERDHTRYVLRKGVLALFASMVHVLAQAPVRFFGTLFLAFNIGRQNARPLRNRLACVAEACTLFLWLRRSNVVHLHAHFATNSAEVAMLANALGGPPYSFTVHGGTAEFDRLRFLGIAEKTRRAAFVAVVSHYGRSQICRLVDRAQWSKIHIVHCGLDPSFYDDAPTSRNAPAAGLVCVGRLSPEKGQSFLVEALGRLAQRGIRASLVIAGDGESRRDIEALVRSYGLDEQVTITGWASESQVRSHILASLALVLPSSAEGLPVVLMEAMALKRPVVSTYVGGIPELVRDEVEGWLVPAGDVERLATAIEKCLLRNSAELAQMGESAHRRVLERHSIHVEASKLARLIRSGPA